MNLILQPLPLLAATTLMLASTLAAQKPYSPLVPNPLEESWRWQEVREARGYLSHRLDDAGNLWVLTFDGVLRYDGFDWLKMPRADHPELEDALGIHIWQGENPVVRTRTGVSLYQDGNWERIADIRSETYNEKLMVEDRWGHLWVGTQDGLMRIAPSGEIFNELPGRIILALNIRKDNEIWAGFLSGAIFRGGIHADGLDATGRQQIYRVFRHLRGNTMSLDSSAQGDLWAVATRIGEPVMRYDEETDDWLPAELPDDPERRTTYNLMWDSRDRLWISMQARLLCLEDGDWRIFSSSGYRVPFRIYHLSETPDGRIWIAERGSLLYAVDAYNDRWISYQDLSFKTEDHSGRLWFTSADRAVVQYDPEQMEWLQYTATDGILDHPVSIHVDQSGRVWACGSHQNAAAVSVLSDGVWHTRTFPEFAPGFGVESVLLLNDGRFALGWGFATRDLDAFSGGLIIAGFNDSTGIQAEHIAPPAVPASIASISQGSDGTIYFAGSNLRWFDGEVSGVVSDYVWRDFLPETVRTVNDDHGNIWVSHWGRGVACWDGEEWTIHTTSDGLASDLVARIYHSPDGSIWAGTARGYSRFDENGWVPLALPSYFIGDRGPNELRFQSDGSVWANRLDQFWYDAHPGEFDRSQRRLSMRTVHYRPGRVPPQTHLNMVPSRVSPEGNVLISWRGRAFGAFEDSGDLNYSYRINGGPWSSFAPIRQVTLTSLPKGEYKFEVRARDRDLNIDQTPAIARFEVAGVIWQEPWFLLLIGTFIALVAFLVSTGIRMRIRHLVHMEELKTQFLTYISHELRTPLSVIVSPLQSLRERATDLYSGKLISTALRNAEHMVELIDELVDFQRSNRPSIPLVETRIEVRTCFREIVTSLEPLFQERRQDLHLSLPEEPVWILLDQAKLHKILDNLLTNAIKYTQSEGRIRIEVQWRSDNGGATAGDLVFSVEDNGPGIPRRSRNKVFQPFYRVRGSKRDQQAPGTGIGLALVWDFVNLMGGEISVASPVTELDGRSCGSRFTVRLPAKATERPTPLTNGTASGNKRKPVPRNTVEVAAIRDEVDRTAASDSDSPDDENTPASTPIILLVDDNADLRFFLKGELHSEFDILEATNAAEGKRLAEDHVPDLIISDLMMPDADGFQLTRCLKENIVTSHIPVILLTARKSFEAQLAGLETGAEDFITKPVNIHLLRQKIRNVMEHRRLLREKFSRQVFIGPSEVSVTPADEKFLRRAIQIIEQRMDDFEYDVNAFAKEMGMSRATLYRKFKAISGEAPTIFLRNMRLERSAQYLKSGELTVSEVLGKVGFLDHSYFTACFKKRFGCTPSEYHLKSKREDGED